jgi:hypothetical protein
MLKAESKKMLQTFLTAISIFSMLAGVVLTTVMVAYASNGQNNNDDSLQNKACYNAGLTDGQKNSPYSQSMVNQCGVKGHAYYQGFISGCITGQGKDFFSCQSLTNAPIGGGNSSTNAIDNGSSNNDTEGNG